MQPRAETTLAAAIAALSAWTVDPVRKALYRRLQFATFGEALAAMVRIGIEADKADHHPEWTNVYATIDIWLTTHDEGGISKRDVALADTIDTMFPAK
ncbi:MAG TPA: 4a-hydroxytetrahydrobiopterin dehydratase [Sphingobium sp.]